MSEKKKIKSVNTVQIVGTLVETGNLVFDESAVNKNNKEIKGAINRADFHKPSFVIESNGHKIGVNTMPTYQKKEKDGEIIDNPQFKALEKNMGYEVGTRVIVKGSISVGNPYMGKNGVVEPVSIQMFSMSSSSVPEEDMSEGRVSGYIKSIKDEEVNEESTGRLVVNFWMYDSYNDAVVPFPIVVDSDIADDFEDNFENGDTAILDFDVLTRKVGGKSESKGFGNRKSKITNGFSVTEYSVFNGEVVDEESDYYIDSDVFKKYFKAHEQKCEEARNASNKSEDKPRKGLGESARKSHIEDTDDDDECPFD